MSVELRILATMLALAAAFAAGAWWGQHDRLCVTAPSGNVWCAQGQPAEELGQ